MKRDNIKKLFETVLTEDLATYNGDQALNDREARRAINVVRTAKEARKAAKKAREKGNNAQAEKLETMAQELED
jgi:hypothetical protein